ncbi:hypothetical protein ACFWMP_14130 [Paenibacillus sp. NPDC058367]|uniref:hypothetical protein n=1 Tax=Paenibacillus sp. NPDC058367 TaxID=3346460 RepID=UPI0036487CE2
MKPKFRITNKRHALVAALQSGAAKDFAIAKYRRKYKHEASKKVTYSPGSLGPSVVTAAIIKEYGGVLTRSIRKAKAKRTGEPFIKFYSHK